MLLRKYEIRESSIPGAGRGLFVTEFIARGDVIVAPTHPDDVNARHYVALFSRDDYHDPTDDPDNGPDNGPDDRPEPEIRDIRLINHSFAPTGHWHLGFVFACHDLPAGTEITVDYRLFGNAGCLPFVDGSTGREVSGFSEQEALQASLQRLREITGDAPLRPALDG